MKHVFTGPDKGLEKQAKKLFYQIQEDIELSWQSVKTGIAEGALTRFSYRFRQKAYLWPCFARPVLLLGVAPPWLDRQRDPTMHPRGTGPHFPTRRQLL